MYWKIAIDILGTLEFFSCTKKKNEIVYKYRTIIKEYCEND